ncbi:hypothetical protein [Actinoalloteichus fjordicus]|uniref:Uncharacterized protein n=1 Tax=Actinoalloteichus fjordicus TaxID=1612552 RepID=A0AAC9L7W4_9PSEU|nr:hypothetical protein [Actinoalloteichus fjordicus]APU13008.1 hypothetical protein UA74_04645 [Actinoalloteichus fjordicus]
MEGSRTEHLIEAAFERQAEEAPSAEPVAARLPALRSRRRRRRALTGLAVVAVVGALAVPTALRAFPPAAAPAPPAGQTVESRVAEPPGPPPIPMRYTVGWLPDDFVEVSRNVDVEGGFPQTQRWAPLEGIEQGDPEDLIENVVRFTAYDPDEINWDTVAEDLAESGDPTVNGSPAMLDSAPGHSSNLVWMPDDSTVLTVRVGDIPGADTEDVAYRVAESVRPGGESPFHAALEPGWLPPTLTVSGSGVMRLDDAWGATLSLTPPDAHPMSPSLSLWTRVADSPDRLPEHGAGTPVRVGDRDGTFWPARDTSEGPLSAVLQVQLSDGRWLETTFQDHENSEEGREIGGQESMVRFAEELIFLEEPAGGWFGD